MKPKLSSVELYVDAHGYWRADITDTSRRERGDGVMGEVKAGDLVYVLSWVATVDDAGHIWTAEYEPQTLVTGPVARRLAEAEQRGEDVRAVVLNVETIRQIEDVLRNAHMTILADQLTEQFCD